MSFEAERRSIESHFQQRWLELFASDSVWSGYPTPPTSSPAERAAYDNVAFDVPGQDLQNPENSVWVRLTILPAGASQITVGTAPLLQHNGVISVQIFHPINAKSNVLARFADIVSNIFDLASIPVQDAPGVVVQCLRSTLVRVGPFNDWYQANVNTTYVRQGQAGVATAADRLIDFGVLEDVDDGETWVASADSPVFFSSSLSTRVVFPETGTRTNRFYFEPRDPSRFAFGAVYNTALDSSVGEFDWRWRPYNPSNDLSRIVYASTPYAAGTSYLGTIHHLFEVA